MRILVLGGTGAIGAKVVDLLLGSSHQVIIYARKPSKLNDNVITNRLVTIIKGELSDVAGLRRAILGVEVVISTLGPKVKNGPFHPSNTPLAKAYGNVVELMKEKGVKRIILLGTTSMKDPNDTFSLEFKALVSGVALFATNAYRDVVAIGETIRADPDLDYTIIRVPILTDDSDESFVVGYVGDKHIKTTLSRRAFAAFVMQELYKNQWIRKQPLISSP
ncbi:hypothetical protein Clacol_003495 [Clathrus columnatus]|uniref:NAD(P)-binding domain-containing protein n=1 Tax=Clathrus columnatus TaxID=1419009 RepID=A0AAV5A732_9AGAM|nr:hypothetical protein Clacol_003495 [Clathrus columnatus]